MKEVTLKVEKTAFGGEGLAHLPDGKTCFIEGALPGETVSTWIISDKKNFVKARLKQVIEASPDRVTAPCPYYDHCGGCQYQHAAYSAELKFKEEQVRELLSRQASIDPGLVAPIRFAQRDYGYRNSVTLHAQKTTFGFIGKDNRSVIPVKNCLLADERLRPVFGFKLQKKKKADRVTFKLDEKGKIASDLEETFFRIRLKDESFLVSSQGFFQNNLAVTELVADQIALWVEEMAPKVFFDLYAGVGVFSFLSAKRVPKVVCIEESPQSVQALKMNRDERKRISTEILEGRVERIFPEYFQKSTASRTLILMDPPRQGLDADFARFLAEKSGNFSMIYLSCDPATLARDLKTILSGGRAKVVQIIPFDMFPRTAHVEVLVRIDGLIG